MRASCWDGAEVAAWAPASTQEGRWLWWRKERYPSTLSMAALGPDLGHKVGPHAPGVECRETSASASARSEACELEAAGPALLALAWVADWLCFLRPAKHGAGAHGCHPDATLMCISAHRRGAAKHCQAMHFEGRHSRTSCALREAGAWGMPTHPSCVLYPAETTDVCCGHVYQRDAGVASLYTGTTSQRRAEESRSVVLCF